MDNTVFAGITGRIRSMETKLLGMPKLESLSDASDFEGCIEMLKGTRYDKYINMPSYDEGLKIAVQDLYKEMHKMSPAREVVDIMAVKYDAHNIKCLIKGRLSDLNVENILIDAGTIPVPDLMRIKDEKNFKGIPNILARRMRESVEVYKKTHISNDIDVNIDRGTFEYMMEISKKSGMKYLTEYTSLIIDVTNIMSFIRLKAVGDELATFEKMFIQGGNIGYDIFSPFFGQSLDKFASKIFYTGYYKWANAISEYMKANDIGYLEKFRDDYIMDFIKKARYVSLGPQIVIAYIAAVENEIRMLRIILTGKKNNVKPESIKKRLRDVYV
ncbi:MAG: V-type ATP synthase subunit C [Clostridiales bacterium]|nr:V-type ATP synthase subunit C [Clostridiales bacterium]